MGWGGVGKILSQGHAGKCIGTPRGKVPPLSKNHLSPKKKKKKKKVRSPPPGPGALTRGTTTEEKKLTEDVCYHGCILDRNPTFNYGMIGKKSGQEKERKRDTNTLTPKEC